MKPLKSTAGAKSSQVEPDYLGQYAGFASRFISFIIDFLILAVTIAITGLLLSQLLEISRFVMNSLFGLKLNIPDSAQYLISFILLISIYAIYYLFFWGFTGTTIGGFIMGIRMVNKAGNKPTFIQCLVRFAMEFLLLPMLFFGSIWIMIDSRRQAWYDKIARTYVIYNWAARPDERFWTRGKIQEFLEGNKHE